jgi:hypothetical protein
MAIAAREVSMTDKQKWFADQEPIRFTDEEPFTDNERIRFTDEEFAFLRHARFGELPPRIKPEDMVELVETDRRRDVPETLGDPDVWRDLRIGGAHG